MTFRDLTEKLWGLRGDGRVFIEQAAREALIDELLTEVGSGGFSESLQTAGGKRFLVELVQASAASDKRDRQGQLSSMLAPFIDAYEKRLSQRALIEPDVALLNLADRGVFMGAAYGLLGFMDFPPAQRAYVQMLTTHTDVAIAVTCEPTGDATEEGRRFAADLKAQHWESARQEASLVQVGIDSQDNAAAELSALRADFLNDDALDHGVTPKGTPSILQFRTVQGEDAEILTAVQAAKSSLDTIILQCKIASGTGKETPTDDAPVALVFRHLGPVITRLAQALDHYQIPAAFDVKVPFRQAGLAAALCALLQLPQADDDLATIASDYLLSAYSGKTQSEAAALEQCLREGRRGYVGYSSGLCSQLGVPELHHLKAEEWAQLATKLLFRGNAVERNGYLRQLDFAAHKVFLSHLAEQRELEFNAQGMRSAGSDPESPLLDSRKILAGLMTARIDLTPAPGSTQLLVSEAPRVRGRQFDTVILAGLAQQDFAASAEPSFSERAIAQLTGRTEPDKLAGEHQLWYDLLGCARQSLILIGQDRDLSGQKLIPSALLEELRVLSERFGRERYPDPISAISGTQHTQELRLLQTFTPLGSGKAARLLVADPEVAPRCPVRGQLTGLDFGKQATPPFAVTTLEYYARCPYSWFLSRHVARKGIRDNVDAINEGLILHAALQHFYEQAPEELGEAHVRTVTLPLAYQLLDCCFDAATRKVLKADAVAQLPVAIQASLEALREALHGFLADEATWMPGFTPRYFEQKFGGKENEPAPVIAGVTVRGAIDRIDTYEPTEAAPEAEIEDVPVAATAEGLFFIVDYKRTGAVHGGQLSARANNKEIQATVYGLVAQQLLVPLRYAGSAYRNIMNPKNLKIEHPISLRKRYWEQMGFPEKSGSTPAAISDERKKGAPSTYEKGIATIEAIVADAAAGLAAGDATITAPLDKDGNEKDCPFATFCPFVGCLYYKRKSWS